MFYNVLSLLSLLISFKYMHSQIKTKNNSNKKLNILNS